MAIAPAPELAAAGRGRVVVMARTVKVRVAVVVGPDGQWMARGWDTANGLEWGPLRGVGEPQSRFWLTAEVPIAIEVAADVEPAGGGDGG